MVTRKEQAARSKALLTDVARRLFVEQGYEATSISQILDQAKMAKGALYHHFPGGKKDVFLEVVDIVDHQLHEGFDEILATASSPVEQILAGFDVLLRLAPDRDFGRIILIEAAAVVPGGWEQGSEYQLLRDAIDRGIQAGELQPVPLDAAAATLFGAARRSADFVARSSNPATAAKDASTVLRALVDGLRVS